MAKLTAGILSRPRGKVASVVGGVWKGISYIREKVTPKNPNTPLQQSQRSNIRFAVAWTKTLIGVLLIPLLDRFTRRKSAYNAVVGWNAMQFEGISDPNSITADTVGTFGNLFRVARGSLSNVPGMTLAVATGTITLSWTPANVGTLQSDDYVLANLSTLDGSQPSVQVQAEVSTGTCVIPAASTTNMVGKKCLLTVIVVRYNRPDTQEVPNSISNSLTSIITR
jgi:hypothetical protein